MEKNALQGMGGSDGQDAQAMSSERIKQNQMLLSLMVTCPTQKAFLVKIR